MRLQPLLQAAVGRWRARAVPRRRLAGAALAGGRAVVIGDRAGLSQALDNLIVNAIEHGGPSIVVEARRGGTGCASRSPTPAALRGRPSRGATARPR